MNEELRAKLTADLQKSGFYSEMVAIRACVAAKWECHGSVTYLDKDERATRECDFEAVKRMEALRAKPRTAVVVARLIGQVKKSEKPLIVFKDADLQHEDDGWRNIIHAHSIETGNRRLAQALHARSLMATNGWKAAGAHEAFKKPTDHSMWYSAFVTVCKAAESAYDTAASGALRRIYFELIKPIVVLDGMIVVAELDADAELVLTEVPNAAFRFEFRSEAYHRSEYYVDVVTLKGFPAYLDLIAKRIEKVSHTLHDSRKRR